VLFSAALEVCVTLNLEYHWQELFLMSQYTNVRVTMEMYDIYSVSILGRFRQTFRAPSETLHAPVSRFDVLTVVLLKNQIFR